MFVAKQKRHENIAEYLLYMWQVEDILRALHFDPAEIHRYIERGYDCSEEQRREVEEWYLSLTELTARLEALSSELLRDKSETLFATLYYAALPAIVQLRDKGAGGSHDEVETALIGLYGYVQLREQGREVSEETLRGMRQLSTFLALLADRFRTSEEES